MFDTLEVLRAVVVVLLVDTDIHQDRHLCESARQINLLFYDRRCECLYA